jgi:hypothetical protein
MFSARCVVLCYLSSSATLFNGGTMKLTKALFLTLFTAMASQAAVWQTTEQWDDQWEAKYNDWVRVDYSTDIFTAGKWKGVPTDCADAVYAARAIFAYENGLPFAVKDTSGGKKLITNDMSRFDRIEDPVARVKKFLMYVFDMTNTRSVGLDSFPVEISRDWVKPGGTWVRPRRTINMLFSSTSTSVQPGHAELIKEVKDTGVIYFIGSTVPQANRDLHLTNDLIFLPDNRNSGLRYFLTPEQYGLDKSYLPGFSMEQFEMGQDGKDRKLKKWKKEVTDRLKLRDESLDEMKFRYAENFCEKMKSRVSIIRRSEKERSYIRGVLGRCMNEREYDLYSTPSRDGKAKKVLMDLLRLEYKTGFLTKKRIRKMEKYFKPCGDIEYLPGKKISMTEAAVKIYKDKMADDPNQPIGARWGVEKKKVLACKKYY